MACGCCSNGLRSLSPNSKRIVNLCGPLMTCFLVAFILFVYSFLVFEKATDRVAVNLKIGACIWGCLALVFTFACHATDPGLPLPDPNDPGPTDMDHRTRERTTEDGTVWEQKWCRECKLWRPYRCGHCHMCGRCVLRLDHHCVWMGTCIGEQNMRFFAGMFFCAGAGMLFLVALGMYRLIQLQCHTFSCWSSTWEPAVILLCLCCCPPGPTCFVCASFQLTCGGVGYISMMLADTDYHGVRRICLGLESATACMDNFLKCTGAQAYFCGPIVLKKWAPVRLIPACGEPSLTQEEKQPTVAKAKEKDAYGATDQMQRSHTRAQLAADV